MSCPSKSVVDSMVSGSLDAAAHAECARHVTSCDECRGLVSQLVTQRRNSIATGATLGANEIAATSSEDFPRLDRYIIESVVGKGGMGIVYAAHDTMLARRVALKLIRPDRALGDARTRLLREAQAMARLTHANVVTVHDVGMFGDQLFVAMEFVDGMTLRSWLQAKKRPWRDVLAAFIQAGRGLEAAHVVDLVHRDFKPENALRGVDGRVRVTDFGLTHLAHEPTMPPPRAGSGSDELRARITVSGSMLGTPAYMSPEQYLGARTDARTDQFSFCVALYEALYDQHPFGGDTVAELAERVLSPSIKPPPKSSSVPERVRKAIFRGLSTAPDRRHPSMRELLQELEVVLAPPRRRRVLVLAAICLVASGALWVRHPRAQPCSGASSRLASEWSESVRSEVSSALLSSGGPYAQETAARATAALDAYATAWGQSSTQSCEATERDEQSQVLLDVRAACLNERLEEFTALVHILRNNGAEVTARSAGAALALTPLSTCDPEELVRERLLDAPERRAEIARVRSYVAEAKAFSNAGLYAKSLERAQLAVQASATTAYPPAIAEALLRQGLSEHQLGKSLASTATLQRALDAAERAGLDELRALAAIELLKAFIHATRFDEAEKFAKVAEAISDRLHRPTLLEIDRNDALCGMRFAQEKFADARAACAHALALVQSLAQSPDEKLARAFCTLGNVELRLGHADTAIEDEKKALAILERSVGPNTPPVAEQLDEVGGMLSFVGRYPEAATLQAHALAIAEKSFGADEPELGIILENYAATLFSQDKVDEAEKLRRRALQIFDHSEPYPGMRAHVLLGLGNISIKQHKLEQAERELIQAEKLAEQVGGPDGYEASSVRGMLGDVERERGELPAAIATHQRTCATVSKIVGKDHPDVAMCLRNLGGDYLAAREGNRALAIFKQALTIDKKSSDSTAADHISADHELIAKAAQLADGEP